MNAGGREGGGTPGLGDKVRENRPQIIGLLHQEAPGRKKKGDGRETTWEEKLRVVPGIKSHIAGVSKV